MATGVISTSAVSADEKKTNYQAYAAELDKFAYYGDDLGANYTEKSTTFKVWSPKASAVSVDIYEKGSEEDPAAVSRMEKVLPAQRLYEQNEAHHSGECKRLYGFRRS